MWWKLPERLGLDWFPIMLGIVNFDKVSTLYPKTLPEVRAKFDNINDEQKLDDAINFCDGLLKREENRSDKIESKAFTLIGVTGIAAGFITGFAALLLDPGKIIVTPVSIIAAILYVLVVISLMVTILLAVRVVIVHDYRFTYPSANDIFKLADANLAYVKRERAVSLFYSFAQNVHIVNRKATYLGGAQLWFRNSIMLLLLLSLCLAAYTPIRTITVTAPIFTPTPTLTSTNTAIPSSTPTPVITPTSIPVVTPSWTPTVTPTVTATHTPAPTPSNTSTTTPLPSSTVPAARTP